MTHEDDPTLRSHAAEAPLGELPRLREVAARMRPTPGAEAAVALRLRQTVAQSQRQRRTTRKRTLTFAGIVLASVPGLVAAHPDARHWMRQFADKFAAVLPWSHEPAAVAQAPNADLAAHSAAPPLAPGQLDTAQPQSTAVAQQVAAEANGQAVSQQTAASPLDPSRAPRSLNGRPEPPSSDTLPRPLHSTAESPAGEINRTSASTLTRERELLERAQRLCIQGNPSAALLLVGQHARDFPSGALVPERLALRARAESQLALHNDFNRVQPGK